MPHPTTKENGRTPKAVGAAVRRSRSNDMRNITRGRRDARPTVTFSIDFDSTGGAWVRSLGAEPIDADDAIDVLGFVAAPTKSMHVLVVFVPTECDR